MGSERRLPETFDGVSAESTQRSQHVVKFVSLFILFLSVVHAGSLKTGQLWPG